MKEKETQTYFLFVYFYLIYSIKKPGGEKYVHPIMFSYQKVEP